MLSTKCHSARVLHEWGREAAIGETSENLKAAVDMYPGMAKTAREEDFNDIAD